LSAGRQLQGRLRDPLSFSGVYPFRRLGGQLRETCRKLREFGFQETHALGFGSLFYRDVWEGNREVLREIEGVRCGIGLNPLAGVNPLYSGDRVIRAELQDSGFRAAVLAPQYHGFRPQSPRSLRVLALLEELGFPIVLLDSLEDPREWHRAYLFKYSVRVEDLRDFLRQLRLRDFKGKLLLALPRFQLIKDNADLLRALEVYVDVSHDSVLGPPYDQVKWVVENLGEEAVVLSSRSPMAYISALMAKVLHSGIGEEAKLKVLSRNVRKFYGGGS